VLANPASSVMPVMAVRASRPYRRTSAAKAASYSPAPMARPINSHAATSDTTPCAAASSSRPAANSPLAPMSTGRPPWRSISRPASGPHSADTISAIDSTA